MNSINNEFQTQWRPSFVGRFVSQFNSQMPEPLYYSLMLRLYFFLEPLFYTQLGRSIKMQQVKESV